MSSSTVATTTVASRALSVRWYQLLAAVVCMMAISSPQYVWTLFTGPLTERLSVPLSQLQITFSLLIVLQTFFSPLQGFLVDRFGVRRLVAVGALATGAGGFWRRRPQRSGGCI